MIFNKGQFLRTVQLILSFFNTFVFWFSKLRTLQILFVELNIFVGK